MGEPKSIDTEEAKRYLDAHNVADYNLIDVRQDWEYEEFHLPGAKLIPLPELVDRLDEIPSEKPTLVYCAVGGRSASAASLLSGLLCSALAIHVFQKMLDRFLVFDYVIAARIFATVSTFQVVRGIDRLTLRTSIVFTNFL